MDYKPLANSDEAGLWHIFDQEEDGIRESPLLVRDEALNTYVKRVVCNLIGLQCDASRVYILDIPVFNAECAPNGMVFVFTGLLLRTQNEAQLAFVLGHEFTHFFRRHSLNAYESRRDTATAFAFLSLGAGAAGAGVAVNLAQLAALGALLSYSRDQEREADAGGFDLAVAAGYDPRQGAMIWRAMSEEDSANPHKDKPSLFLANHPADKERLATMSQKADEAETKTHSDDLGTQGFQAAVAPYRDKWLAEELNRGEFYESIVVIDHLIADEPSSASLQYYLGEAYRRRNGKGDLDSAIQSYELAVGLPDVPVAAYRGLGMAALKAEKNDVARDAFAKYLELAPQADDKAMVQIYLTKAGG